MKTFTVYYVLMFFFNFIRCYQKMLLQLPFPDDFQFGVATASYQIEGAWNENGKGENIWDYLTHNNASHITDRSTGDIACDSYHKHKEDVQLIKSLGVEFYRFSLSWSRILPTGYPNFVNPDGIRYYNDLINELLANKIEPMVTIFHWDLPQRYIGKGENIWDYLTHNNASHITDRSTGDIACDSYHKYKEDVQLIKSLGVDFYRFSLSWSRILPTGYPNFVNPDGIRYYNDLINELLANKIEPMVTIFHWDLPQPLQEIGGWPNPALVEHYVNFARIAFENFGDRVKKWITFNEPMQICKMGYGDAVMAPAYSSSGMADYMCTYTVIKAHSQAYHMYNNTYRPIQNGEVGYTLHSFWFEPSTRRIIDSEAAERMFQFYTAIFIHPIYGDGDWPETVKHYVEKMSRAQNFTSSRLPAFTHEEIELNKGTADFLGLNYYTSAMVTSIGDILYPVKWDNDGRFTFQSELEIGSPVGPVGLRKIMKKIKNLYGDYKIIITENGVGTPDRLNDYDRANYYLTYLQACLEAIYIDDVKLIGYTAWSLMDNFEWSQGYTNRFGIHHVDFTDPNRKRTRKLSANIFEDVVRNRRLPKSTVEVPLEASHSTILQQSLLFIILTSTIIGVCFW